MASCDFRVVSVDCSFGVGTNCRRGYYSQLETYHSSLNPKGGPPAPPRVGRIRPALVSTARRSPGRGSGWCVPRCCNAGRPTCPQCLSSTAGTVVRGGGTNKVLSSLGKPRPMCPISFGPRAGLFVFEGTADVIPVPGHDVVRNPFGDVGIRRTVLVPNSGSSPISYQRKTLIVKML